MWLGVSQYPAYEKLCIVETPVVVKVNKLTKGKNRFGLELV
jgi:hypothetical protein